MISEIEREKVLKQLDDAAEAIRNNPQVILQRKNSAKRLKLYPQKKGLKCGLVS